MKMIYKKFLIDPFYPKKGRDLLQCKESFSRYIYLPRYRNTDNQR